MKRGRPPIRDRRLVSVYLDGETYQGLSEEAQKQRRARSDLARAWIMDRLTEIEEDEWTE